MYQSDNRTKQRRRELRTDIIVPKHETEANLFSLIDSRQPITSRPLQNEARHRKPSRGEKERGRGVSSPSYRHSRSILLSTRRQVGSSSTTSTFIPTGKSPPRASAISCAAENQHPASPTSRPNHASIAAADPAPRRSPGSASGARRCAARLRSRRGFRDRAAGRGGERERRYRRGGRGGGREEGGGGD